MLGEQVPPLCFIQNHHYQLIAIFLRASSSNSLDRYFFYRIAENSIPLNQLKSNGIEGIFKARNETSMYDFRRELKLSLPTILTMVDLKDLKVHSSSKMTSLMEEQDNLMNLPSDVGTKNNPLLVTYVDRSVKGLIFNNCFVLKCC